MGQPELPQAASSSFWWVYLQKTSLWIKNLQAITECFNEKTEVALFADILFYRIYYSDFLHTNYTHERKHYIIFTVIDP
jgi:hypothetical protein